MDLNSQTSQQFEYTPSIRVLFACGAIRRLGELANELNCSRVLLVTDPGIRKAGHAEIALQSLQEAGKTVFVFDAIDENPTTVHVDSGAAFATERGGIDLIVGLGGGSAMDVAKGINFLLTNGGRMEDYWGFGKAGRDMLPSIGIPTTAGTGSEAQSYALIEQVESKRKMACGDLKARFRAVILDPELTFTAPRSVTAVSGIDAVGHAIESYVTRVRTPVSQMHAREAWRLLDRNYEMVLRAPQDADARGGMLLGAHLAGAAIEASMLGAAHACANPLTSRYGVTHGIAVGVMLPHVITWNAPAAEALFAELLQASGRLDSAQSAAAQLRSRIAGMLKSGDLPQRLQQCGVEEHAIPALARDAAQQWTGTFNPRPVSESDFEELYRNAL